MGLLPKFKSIIGMEFGIGSRGELATKVAGSIMQMTRPAVSATIAISAEAATVANQRDITITLLDRLTPDEWQRPARHAIFGPTHLQELVAFTSEHDRLHLRQMRENIRAFGL